MTPKANLLTSNQNDVGGAPHPNRETFNFGEDFFLSRKSWDGKSEMEVSTGRNSDKGSKRGT